MLFTILEEATFYLQRCGLSSMAGDGDRIIVAATALACWRHRPGAGKGCCLPRDLACMMDSNSSLGYFIRAWNCQTTIRG